MSASRGCIKRTGGARLGKDLGLCPRLSFRKQGARLMCHPTAGTPSLLVGDVLDASSSCRPSGALVPSPLAASLFPLAPPSPPLLQSLVSPWLSFSPVLGFPSLPHQQMSSPEDERMVALRLATWDHAWTANPMSTSDQSLNNYTRLADGSATP